MILREAKVVYTDRHIPVTNPSMVRHSADVIAVLRETGIQDEAQEVFMVLHLNTRHQVLAVQKVARGSLGAVNVHPREIFRAAVMHGAAAIILVHNHPSGDAAPSADDHKSTTRLRDAGELLGIPVLDHVILADASHTSMALCDGWA